MLLLSLILLIDSLVPLNPDPAHFLVPLGFGLDVGQTSQRLTV